MAYIAPNTSIILYGNVPLDKWYNHTYLFVTQAQQHGFFSNPTVESGIEVVARLEKYYYVRDGVLKVQLRKEVLEGCNYMRFRNTMDNIPVTNAKYFYAFVDEIRWINNDTCELYYTIDVMQTYLFNIELLPSYVEREHTDDDGYFVHHIPEDISASDDYLLNSIRVEKFFNPTTKTFCMSSKSTAQGNIGARVIHNQINGAFPTIIDNPLDLESYVQNNNNGESVLSAVQIPSVLDLGNIGTSIDPPNPAYDETSYPISVLPSNNAIDGYVPKNKKLYNFPYVSVILTNNAGENITLKPELSTNGILYIRYMGTCVPSPVIYAFIKGYADFPDTNIDYEHSVSLTNYPDVAIVTDAYKNYLQRNGLSMLLGIAMTAGLGSHTAVKTGEILQQYTGNSETPSRQAQMAFDRIALQTNVSTQRRIGESIGSLVGGKTLSGSGINIASKGGGFRSAFNQYKINLNIYTITSDNAKIIDDYFTKYGYACKRTKIPNRTCREYFNYVKTNGCNLRGNAPMNVISDIKHIYDNGVTFWHNPDVFCDYSVDNAIV